MAVFKQNALLFSKHSCLQLLSSSLCNSSFLISCLLTVSLFYLLFFPIHHAAIHHAVTHDHPFMFTSPYCSNMSKCWVQLCVVVMSDRYVGHVLGNVHVAGSGPIWLDNVLCTNTCATDLGHCTHNGWGVHYCDHSDDVSIACYDRTSEPTTTPTTTAATTTASTTTSTTTTSPTTTTSGISRKISTLAHNMPIVGFSGLLLLLFSYYCPLRSSFSEIRRQIATKFAMVTRNHSAAVIFIHWRIFPLHQPLKFPGPKTDPNLALFRLPSHVLRS